MLFELDNLDFNYADGTPALSRVNLRLERGSRIALLGANGSGKSTLMRLLCGLVEPSSGAIRYEGELLTEKSLRGPDLQFRFRSDVGFVFQDADAQLFNATVWEEIAFGPRQLGLGSEEVERRVEDTVRFLSIGHLTDRPPFRLSGGEKRKVAIASVLSMNPGVILFDEPVAGLDPRTQRWLVETLRALQAAGKTTIVSTHNLSVVPQIADRVILLGEDHRLLAFDHAAPILEDPALLAKANLIDMEPTYA